MSNTELEPETPSAVIPRPRWTTAEDEIVLQTYLDHADSSIEVFRADAVRRTGISRDVPAYYVRIREEMVEKNKAEKNKLYYKLREHTSNLKKAAKEAKTAREARAATPAAVGTGPMSVQSPAPVVQTHSPLAIPTKRPGGFGSFTKSARKGGLWNVQDAAYTFHATYPEMWEAINSGRLPTVRLITKSSDEAKDPNFGINIPIISEDVILCIYSQEAKGATSFQEALTKAQPELAVIKAKQTPARSTVKATPAPVASTVPAEAPAAPSGPIATFDGVVFSEAVPAVPAPEPVRATPVVPVRIAGKYDPEFLRETLADIEARALTLEEGVAFLKPTRMQERALRALARGGMSTDEALEIFTVTPLSQ